MGVLKKERGVLKLVHPGRYIERHKKPVPAAEIMQKNPRHSITRPDVFDFPWIVVKPDSILTPGSVFLIVPNHAIYMLLKDRKKSLTNPEDHNVRFWLETPFQTAAASSGVEFEHKTEDSRFEFTFSTARDFYLGMCSAGGTLVTRESNNEIQSTLTLLRSCISKQNSYRKLLRLKVDFLLPYI